MNTKNRLLTNLAGGGASRLATPLYRGMPVPLFDVAENPSADIKALATELKQIGIDLKASHDGVKKTAETALAEVKSLGDATKETKEAFDKKFTEFNGLVARMTDVEQKLARAPGPGDEPARKSLGDLVTESENWKKANVNSQFRG